MTNPSTALKALPRIDGIAIQTLRQPLDGSHLLLPSDVEIAYAVENDTVSTIGLDPALDQRCKELVSLVRVDDALQALFTELNVLCPRTYADHERIGCHVVAQVLLLVRWTDNTARVVEQLMAKYQYGRQDYDKLWISSIMPSALSPGDVCLVMNRRVGGWDGSVSSPVVELLAGGGHVKTIWDIGKSFFKMQSIKETIATELSEELGLESSPSFEPIGGFVNEVTRELVVLVAITVDDGDLFNIQEYAFGNVEENIDGLYLGEIRDVLRQYLEDASFFAGGEKARPTNFPSNSAVMERLHLVMGGVNASPEGIKRTSLR